jgi:hypothetical protein
MLIANIAFMIKIQDKNDYLETDAYNQGKHTAKIGGKQDDCLLTDPRLRWFWLQGFDNFVRSARWQ